MAQFSQVTYAQPQLIAAGSPSWSTVLAEIVAGPTDWPVVTEIGFINTGAYAIATNGGVIGLGVPQANGVNPQSALYGSAAYDPTSPPSALQLLSGWVTPPTQPASFLRRLTTATEQGAPTATFLKFPRGLQMVANQHLVLTYNATSLKAFAFDIWVEWDN